MRIPKQNRDLRRFVLRRDLKGLLLWLLWVLLWGTGAWAYNANHATYPPERQILGWRLALWLLVSQRLTLDCLLLQRGTLLLGYLRIDDEAFFVDV